MARPRVPVLLAAAAALLGFLQTSFSFEVKESGKICITADLLVNFSVEYPAKGHQEMANFALPQTGTVLLHNSTCGKGDAPTPVLVIGFGMGQSLSLKFMKTSNQYRVEELTFSYNLSDAAFFPSASAGGTMEVSQKTDIQANLGTRYQCISTDQVNMKNVNVTLSNVTLEAYLVNNTLSVNEYECTRDKPMTTIATTTARQTTSQVPTTTSPAPTTLPQNPAVGKYNVTGKNGTCVLASMGLQLNVSYESKDGKTGLDVLNFIPSNTSFSGNCDNSSAFLNLTFGKAKLIFHFVRNTSIEKFFLQGVTVSTTLPPEAKKPQFEAVNNSMSELGASVGNSYMCNAEETLLVTQGAFVNLFSVQVQVFKIDGDKFGAVEECQLDENNMLIPIIVGAALAGLVLIVLIAYLIGRKRSHAGYQTI
ncbi:lysosome-associated membrane glycoprotein 1 isoform X2 [Alligator sinensis]|uniref:Lysosome-associated membrane glycoprotein 1 n=1 Tax=Alligator sinensis TaxID=38654 RepID=A0A1U7RC59_ALLSI|nr:lysosome-associated membrane glycoprotein 1 isoform X2 [Alligator sinensis]